MYLYLNAAKYNLRFHLLPYILAAACLLILIPFLSGITALDAETAAYPFETGLSFLGIILLTPVYSPEQDSGISSTVYTRKTPHLLICILRIVMSAAMLFFFLCAFAAGMLLLESKVRFIHVAASYANAVFLGGIGILTSAVTGRAVTGYMAAVLYFVMDWMGSFRGRTLFSLMRKGTMEGKGVLFLIGVFLTVSSVWVWGVRMKRR